MKLLEKLGLRWNLKKLRLEEGDLVIVHCETIDDSIRDVLYQIAEQKKVTLVHTNRVIELKKYPDDMLREIGLQRIPKIRNYGEIQNDRPND